MPSGKVHDRITIAAALASGPVWYGWLSPLPRDWAAGGILIGATLFSGLLLSPDLDLNSSIYKRWGPFRFLWWPYQKVMPHRSIFSHSFFLGPILRIAYFAFLVWGLFRIVTWGLSFALPLDRNALTMQYSDTFVRFWETHPHHFLMLCLGLFVGTALHCAADILVTGFKKRF